MKKYLVTAVVLSIMLSLVWSVVGFAAEAEYVIKYSTTGPADPSSYIPYAVGLTFKTFVEGRTQNRVKVELYPGGQLGSQRETIEGVMAGTVEAASVNSAALAGFFPATQCLSIPYMIPSVNVGIAVADGPFGQKLMTALRDKTGLVIAGGLSLLGERNLTNSKRPIKTPADMKGLKFRSMDSPVFMKMFQALGANATPISIGEVYLALQQGVVDGQENPVSVIQSYKFEEVQKYLTLDRHVLNWQVMVMSETYLNSLPRDLKKTVLAAARDAVVANRGAAELFSTISLDYLKQKLEVYEPTKEEQAMFKEAATKACMDYLNDQIGEEWVNGIAEAVKEAQEELSKESYFTK